MQSHYAFGGCYLKAKNADKGGREGVLNIQRTTTNKKDKDQQLKMKISQKINTKVS